MYHNWLAVGEYEMRHASKCIPASSSSNDYSDLDNDETTLPKLTPATLFEDFQSFPNTVQYKLFIGYMFVPQEICPISEPVL